jgi:hypothetical protein
MKALRAILVVLLAATLFAAAQAPMKPGVERWPVKTSLVAGADTSHPKSIKFADLIQLAEAPGVKKNDARFQSDRIPAFDNPLNVKEGDIVSVRAWLHIMATESDGDYHIQVSGSRSDGNQCLIVEVPRPEQEYVASAELRPMFDTVRSWAREKLLHDSAKEPSTRGNCMEHPPYVEVTGQLFYDDSHVNDQPRGKRGQKAATLWELHPVTRMRFVARPSPAEPLGTPCPK